MQEKIKTWLEELEIDVFRAELDRLREENTKLREDNVALVEQYNNLVKSTKQFIDEVAGQNELS